MSRTHWARRLAAPCVAAAALASTLAPAAQATTSHAALTASVATATTYVRGLQDANGNYVTSGLSNEWAFSGLAAAGVAAADVFPGAGQTAKNARLTYRTALAAPSWPSASPVVTDYERATLNGYSAGIDPARVSANRNLIADTLAYWNPTTQGYWGNVANFNGTVFGLLALSAAKTPAGAQRIPQALLDKSVAAVLANQHSDGGWTYQRVLSHANFTSAGDIDMTGAVLASLCQAGLSNANSTVVAGKNFLKGKLGTANGAFASMFGANTDSNGWAVSGLNACGIASQGADFTSPTGKTPIDFLVAQQFQPGGGFRYLTTDTSPSAYASLDAYRALAGGAFSATPPTPTHNASEPRFYAAPSFVTGTTSSLALIINDNSGTLKACSVPFSPTLTTTASTTLGTILSNATGSSTPAGCVTGFSPTSGTITTINGVANAGSTSWKSSLDGATAAAANAGTTITLGDTISLKYGS